MVNQHWKLEDQAKVKIAAACRETTTSAQQKRAKIDEIHKETDEAIAKIIPATQLQTFNSCMTEWEKKEPKAPGQKELGPCGGAMPKSGEGQHEGHH